MSRFRKQLAAANREYHGHRYPGSLAADIGLNKRAVPSHTKHPFRLRWMAALAAMLGVVILLRHNHETAQTTPDAGRESCRRPIWRGPGVRKAGPRWASKTLPQPLQPGTTNTTDTTDTTAEVSTAPALSFESVTDWPSVSADVPSLGGFPALELNTQENQAPTTQESPS